MKTYRLFLAATVVVVAPGVGSAVASRHSGAIPSVRGSCASSASSEPGICAGATTLDDSRVAVELTAGAKSTAEVCVRRSGRGIRFCKTATLRGGAHSTWRSWIVFDNLPTGTHVLELRGGGTRLGALFRATVQRLPRFRTD